MADVTIQQLAYGLPSSGAFIPYTDNNTTLRVSPSGLFAKAGNLLLVGKDSIGDLSPQLNTVATTLSSYNAVLRGGWLLNVTDKSTSWGDSAARIGVLRTDAGYGWWFSHNLDGSCGIHQSTQGDRIKISTAGAVIINAQPGFKATIANQSQSSGQTIVWDTLEYATPEGSFNTSTGEWTVPQTGRYFITVNLLSQRNTTAGDWYVDLLVNNSQPIGSRMYTSKAGNANVHAQLNACGIFKLSSGDRVKTNLTSQVGNVNTTTLHNMFSAELLG